MLRTLVPVSAFIILFSCGAEDPDTVRCTQNSGCRFLRDRVIESRLELDLQ